MRAGRLSSIPKSLVVLRHLGFEMHSVLEGRLKKKNKITMLFTAYLTIHEIFFYPLFLMLIF